MKALDIQLKISRKLVDTMDEVIKLRTCLAKSLFKLSYEEVAELWNNLYILEGKYQAYKEFNEMLLDCDEINTQYEAEANAEEEDL